MPLRIVAGQPRLVCANAYPPNPEAEGAFPFQGIPQAEPAFPPGQAHVMVLLPGGALLHMVQPPNAQGFMQQFPMGDIPVRIYACMTCGYVESYLAKVLSPAEWPDV